MTERDDPFAVALDLARALGDHGVSYAIGGALALGVWAEPRSTLDVDIDVFVDDAGLPNLTRCLRALGISIDDESLRQQSDAAGLVVVRWRGLRVDLFTPSIPFAWDAERTRVEIEFEGQRYWFLSAEALAVFKLLFFRAKDLVDLAKLVAGRGDRLDARWVRDRVVEMMGDDDERVVRWDRIVEAGGATD